MTVLSAVRTSLAAKLGRGEFVITAEIVPPLTVSATALIDRVKPLDSLVDAVNVTDAAGARPTLSSFAASAILAREGIEPVLQITCRDRNRIALVGELLGAAAQNVSNLLILHGDDPKAGDMPDAKPVHDLDSRAVMTLARDMRDRGVLPSGREILPPPHYFIGCADTLVDPHGDRAPHGLASKIVAGAQFVQTQFCFDAGLARRYFGYLARHGITEKLGFIVGVGPLLSAKQARFMNEKLFGVSIPRDIIDRLDRAHDPRAEGQAICAGLMREFSEVPGISGIHVMAPLQSPQAIAEAILASGLRKS
jgi:methylenetetrahydrofolate reductase (NADPH)